MDEMWSTQLTPIGDGQGPFHRRGIIYRFTLLFLKSQPMKRDDQSQRLRQAVQDGNLQVVKKLLEPYITSQNRYRKARANQRQQQPSFATKLNLNTTTRNDVFFPSNDTDTDTDTDNDSARARSKTSSRVPLHPLNTYPPTGWTSLHYAVRHDHLPLVRYLLDEVDHEKYGTSLDHTKKTPLMIATIYKREEIARVLAERFPESVSMKCDEGWTALLHAAKHGHEGVASVLLEFGAEINGTDPEGSTALHHAAAWGHFKMVKLLVQSGCNSAIRNRAGWTPLDYSYSNSLKAHLEECVRDAFVERKFLRTMQNHGDDAASSSPFFSAKNRNQPQPPSPTTKPRGSTDGSFAEELLLFNRLSKDLPPSPTSTTTTTESMSLPRSPDDSSISDDKNDSSHHHQRTSVSSTILPSRHSQHLPSFARNDYQTTTDVDDEQIADVTEDRGFVRASARLSNSVNVNARYEVPSSVDPGSDLHHQHHQHQHQHLPFMPMQTSRRTSTMPSSKSALYSAW